MSSTLQYNPGKPNKNRSMDKCFNAYFRGYFNQNLKLKYGEKLKVSGELGQQIELLQTEFDFFFPIFVNQEAKDLTEVLTNDAVEFSLHLGKLMSLGAQTYTLDSPKNKSDIETFCWRKLGIGLACCSRPEYLDFILEFLNRMTPMEKRSLEIVQLFKNEFIGRQFVADAMGEYVKTGWNLYDAIYFAAYSQELHQGFLSFIINYFVEKGSTTFKKAEVIGKSVSILCFDGPETIQFETHKQERHYRNHSGILYNDCLRRDHTVETTNDDLRLHNFMKIIFHPVIEGLKLTPENSIHFNTYTACFHLFIQHYILTHGKNSRAPAMEKINAQVRKFIEVKKENPKLFPYWDLQTKKPKLVLLTPDEIQHRAFDGAGAVPPIEDRLDRLIREAAPFVGRIKGSDLGQRIIFSCEHPDIPHAVQTILPRLEEMCLKGIQVEICRGAFRYNEGTYEGQVIHEISLICHFDTQEQRDYLISVASYCKQESYLYIDKMNKTDNINIKSGDPWSLGTWQEIPPAQPEWLERNQGYSILYGIYYGTQKIVEKKQAA